MEPLPKAPDDPIPVKWVCPAPQSVCVMKYVFPSGY